MSKRKPKAVPLNGAPSQYDRKLRGVGPRSLQIDGRNLVELLSFGPQFASLVRFFDLTDLPHGDWTLFFLTDPTMVLATVAATNIQGLERKLMSSLHSSTAGDPRAQMLDAVRQVDNWLTSALTTPQSQQARLFGNQVEYWIQQELGSHARTLKSHAHHHPSEHGPLDFDGFHPVWGLAGRDTPTQTASPTSLEDVVQAVLLVFQQLKAYALEHIQASLDESSHKPQIAMYIAFAQLFQHAQKTMNTLPRRFMRYYYRDMLRETPAGPVPDSVYLTFTLDPAAGVDAATVPAGTLFPAGKEASGEPILYATTKALSVSAATLARLRTLRIEQGSLYNSPITSPPLSPPLHSIISTTERMRLLVLTEINTSLMDLEAAGKGPPDGLLEWPLFGTASLPAKDSEASNPIAPTSLATLGFAITSSYLLLTGGTRSVQITLHLVGGEDLDAALQDLVHATGLTAEDILQQTVEAGFDLYLSTLIGWFPVTGYTCSVPPSGSPSSPISFTIEFQLDTSAPSIVAFNPTPQEVAKDPPIPDNLNPDPSLPTLKAYLRQAPLVLNGPDGIVELYPLSLLGSLQIGWIDIDTQTKSLSDLTLESTTGIIDSSVPFALFGGQPVPGSALRFSNPEIFLKIPDTQSLRIHIEWFGLPPNQDGFTGYYQGYVIGLDGLESEGPLYTNQTFRCQFSVVNPGLWDLAGVASVYSPPDANDRYLYRTTGQPAAPVPSPEGLLADSTDFDDFEIVPATAPAFYDAATSALQLTLTEPPYAFGNLLYSANVMHAVMANLPQNTSPTGADPDLQPISEASASLGATLQPPAAANSKTSPAAALRQKLQESVPAIQSRLIDAARDFLLMRLSIYGKPALMGVETIFNVVESQMPAYRASSISKRLQAAIASPPFTIGGTAVQLPNDAVEFVGKARQMLESVITIQKGMDNAAAGPDATYDQRAKPQLIATQQQLDAVVNPAPPTVSDAPAVYPNTPLLPQAAAVSLDYTATNGFAPGLEGQTGGSFYLLGPLGGYQPATGTGIVTPLLPIPAPGNLDLGFTGLDAAQDLLLLVQMAAGASLDAPSVTWNLLTGNAWMPLDPAQLLSDTTNSLQNTGVLGLSLPAATVTASTAIPGDYRWIRATTTEPDKFPPAIGIYPHTALATWVPDADLPAGVTPGGHLAQPLPPYTIASSVQKLSAIKTIDQPMVSFGGRPAEDEETFETRLSERLRHKDRAILTWDYQQLVLERYPTIWRVKTLPASIESADQQGGSVRVVVVAGPNGLTMTDPTAPLVDSEVLGDIQSWLASLASPFAVINVSNPLYVRIEVKAAVRFQTATDSADTAAGGSIDRLNADLVGYLSPWYYDAARAARGDDYASEDAIIHFIQNLPYISELVEIELLYDPAQYGNQPYFLTSAKKHSIVQVD